jgi:hypothetical protein
MESLGLESVCYIITKAREFDAKVEVVEPDPGSNASDESMDVVLEDYPDDPVAEELKDFIGGLNFDEQCELVALTWLGRGSYDKEEWAEAVAEARGSHNDRTAEYLMGIPQLGDYLEEGLAALGLSCEEFDMKHL